jgi:transposase InsO family protein
MISACRAQHPSAPLSHLCAALGVNRSWFYARPTNAETDEAAVAIRGRIEEIVLEMPGYGYRRVTEQLHREGWAVNNKRVFRVMREESLLCRLKKRFVVTTDSGHSHPTYPNLLKDAPLSGPDQAWQADITYIRLPGGFCYLAAILDSFSRFCVGWHLSRDIDAKLTLAALERALAGRRPRAGWIHHSDRGVQYASGEYVARLAAARARISMSARGNPYDNAKAESFFKTLKTEEVYLKGYQNFAEAQANLGPFIEAVYNRRRLHSALDYLPPAEFEAASSRSVASELA